MPRLTKPLRTVGESLHNHTLNVTLGVLILALVGVEPALAATTQQSVLCQAKFIPNLLNTIIQLSIFGSGAFAFVTYVGTSSLQSLPISDDRKQVLKQKRGDALVSAGKTFAVGPIVMILINVAGLPIANCLTLVPF